jgi:hypothetical protein
LYNPVVTEFQENIYLSFFYFQIELFLHFIGTNAFYHVMRDARGPSSHTVHRVVHRVSEAINTLKLGIVCWPQDCSRLAKDFFELSGFPLVAGCLDGTHITITPPTNDENSYVNRHHTHSLNVLAVSGPDLTIYYLNTNHPGRCHDAHVLRQSSLWKSFEEDGNRPFPGAVLLGDSAYPLKPWLMTPFSGDPEGAKARYNAAHIKTRNVVERAFGVIKSRFFALKTGIRLKDPVEASKLIISAVILHNLCIKFGDKAIEVQEEEEQDDANDQIEEAEVEEEDRGTSAEIRERRRNQILQFFQR